MNCPSCNTSMVVLEADAIEVDFCPCCRGAWFDGGEVEYLLSRSNRPENELTNLEPAAPAQEKKRRCPRCRRRMNKKVYRGSTSTRAILLDQCPDGDGWWFDDGELREIVTATEPPADSYVTRFLHDLFHNGKKDDHRSSSHT